MASSVQLQVQDFICIAPAVILFIASLMPLAVKIFNNNKEPNSVITVGLGLLGVIGAIAASGLLYAEQQTPFYAFSSALIFDGVSAFSSVLISIVTGITLLLMREHPCIKGRQFAESVFLLINASLGMMILAWANDLIVTFIAIEIMSLCIYLLIALSHEESRSKEAAFKYFVLGSFASAIFLYGVAFIYGTASTTYLDKILTVAPELIETNKLFLFGVIFAIVGFCFKAAIAPFHAWAPDVYEGSPTPVTAYMATGVKLVTFVAFMRFLRGDFIAEYADGLIITVLQWFAVITILVGNIAALVQTTLKRMLAYSSIANSGYIMMGLIAGAIGGDGWRGDLAVLFYLSAYSIMTLGAFAFVSLFEKNENDVVLLEDLNGLSKAHPVAAFCFSLLMLSMAGIPPLIGFFGKFFLFSAAIKQGLFWLVIWAAIGSVISAYYYLRPIVLMYMKDGEERSLAWANQTKGVLLFMAILVVGFGLAAEPLYRQVLFAIRSFL